MPIRDTIQRTTSPSEEALRRELLAELKNPKPSGEPDVVIEGKAPGGVHLFVIWSKWAGLEQTVRSRIILDAYIDWRSEAEAQNVTVSMGLTPDEAKNMGVG